MTRTDALKQGNPVLIGTIKSGVYSSRSYTGTRSLQAIKSNLEALRACHPDSKFVAVVYTHHNRMGDPCGLDIEDGLTSPWY